MARINVYEPVTEQDYDLDRDAKPRLAGWFDDSKAVRIVENERWDGNNMVSLVTGKFEHEALFRTAKGRWVLNHWSQWQGVAETYEFIADEAARDWLMRNESEEELARFFGEHEEEAGPAVIGRPEIGGRVTTALGEERLAQVDAQAAKYGVTRAEAIRRLLDVALVLDPTEGDGPLTAASV